MTHNGTEAQGFAAQPDLTALRKRWGLHTPDSLRVRVRELGGSDYLIKGLLPARSIAILLGDSGIGKSPLAYQAAICLASGVPFLGRETRKGTVAIADFENGIGDMHELVERISRHVGLPEPPNDPLQFWSLNDCMPSYGQAGHASQQRKRPRLFNAPVS